MHRRLSCFERACSLAQKSDDKYNMALCLIGFAGVVLARYEAVRAARLLGASFTLLETSGIQLEPVDRIEYELEIHSYTHNWMIQLLPKRGRKDAH